MSKKQSLKGKDRDALHGMITELSDRVRTIRFGGAGSRTRNTRESRMARRTIARAMTEMRAQHSTKALAKDAR